MSELSFGNKKLGFGLMRLPLLDEMMELALILSLLKRW